LKEEGVYVLEEDCDTLSINGCVIDICGIDDPTEMGDVVWKDELDKTYAQTDSEHFRVLLTHRPEKVSVYTQYDFDFGRARSC